MMNKKIVLIICMLLLSVGLLSGCITENVDTEHQRDIDKYLLGSEKFNEAANYKIQITEYFTNGIKNLFIVGEYIYQQNGTLDNATIAMEHAEENVTLAWNIFKVFERWYLYNVSHLDINDFHKGSIENLVNQERDICREYEIGVGEYRQWLDWWIDETTP